MSESYEVKLPKLGESIHEAVIVEWLKKEGEHVHLDEPLLEVSTDKVNSEIPSPASGILTKLLVKPDQKVEVGALLAVIAQSETAVNSEPKPLETQEVEVNNPLSTEPKKSSFFSPAVMKLAELHGISLSELAKVEGTGAGGRVAKKDLEAYLKAGSCSAAKPEVTPKAFVGCNLEEKEELVQMSAMRKAIAENMVKSFHQAPHASLVTEVDVTDIMHFIRKEKDDFFQKAGAKLTVTSFVVDALAKAAREFPFMNSTVKDEHHILVKHYVNVGIAVSVDQGLVVPVLKGCEKQNFQNIAKGLASLTKKARSGRLFPQDVQEGTITLTNFGISGTLIGTPILRHPEVAIVGMGAVQKRVTVKADNSFGIRDMAYFSLTFDHRVIDGMYGCAFLNALKQSLENYPLHTIYSA
jgi:2-oxoglutarate dehydrogenase E2 component (dihydrolipoamide succinyltransferase)